jgi:competence protein ComFB
MLYNVIEALVRMTFDESFIHKQVLKCECQQCCDDILAYALNHLPSRYVTTDQGNAYVKVQYLNPQLQSDILRELALGAEIVGKNPRHGG